MEADSRDDRNSGSHAMSNVSLETLVGRRRRIRPQKRSTVIGRGRDLN